MSGLRLGVPALASPKLVGAIANGVDDGGGHGGREEGGRKES